MSAPSEEMDIDKSWETFLEQAFLYGREDTNVNTYPPVLWDDVKIDLEGCTDEPASASLVVATDIVSLIQDPDPISLVEKIRTKLRAPIENLLYKRVVQKMNAVQEGESLLRVLNTEWDHYRIFKYWISGIFSDLNEVLVTDGVIEDDDSFRTRSMANHCFRHIVFKPFQSLVFYEMGSRFTTHLNAEVISDIDPEVVLLMKITDFMNQISSAPEHDFGLELSTWLSKYRRPTYHQMACTFLESGVTLEEFVDFSLRLREKEGDACGICFAEDIESGLRLEIERVFFQVYLPKVFWQKREQYKMWVTEEKFTLLEHVNKSIKMDGYFAKEVMEMFRVSFVQKFCSASDIDSTPFLTDKHGSKSPFHICCHTPRSGRILEELREVATSEIELMDTLLNSFACQEALIKVFSVTPHLKRSTARILRTYLTQCENCILPSMLTSLCRHLLSYYGRFGMNPQIHLCCQRVLLFLKFVSDPGAFEKVYVEEFYKGVIENALSSVDCECMILSSFAGSDKQGYVSQGQRMLRNHLESEKLFNLFSSTPTGVALQLQNMKMKLRVNLFRWGTLDPVKRSPFSVPDEINICHRSYETFFKSEHDTANLDWDYKKGTVTIQTHLFSNGQSEWTEIDLNVEQYSVLNLFQENDCISCREIVNRVIMVTSDSFNWGRTLKSLTSVILSMTSPLCPLLKKDPDTSSLSETDKVTLNTHFISTRAKIKVPEPQYDSPSHACGAEGKPGIIQTLCIESAIMRVMKDLRRASRERLLALVISKVAGFHQVNETSFDDCLQRLIERDYIAKQDGIESYYTYVL